MKTIFWFLVGVVVLGCDTPTGRAAEAAVDTERGAVIVATLDAFCAGVEALKPQFPALANFGDPAFTQRGPGWVHYDFKTKPGPNGHKEAEPDGAGIFFRLSLLDAPKDPLEKDFDGVDGGARLGVTMALYVGQPVNLDGHPALALNVKAAQGRAMNEVFYPGMAAIVLAHAGVPADTESRLAAIEQAGSGRTGSAILAAGGLKVNDDTTLGLNIVILLKREKLTPAQLTRIRQALAAGLYAPSIWWDVAECLRQQDPEHWPESCADLLRVALQAELKGADSFTATPFFGSGWASTARDVRSWLSQEIGRAKDARFLPAAKFVLENDPVVENRLTMLPLLGQLDTAESYAALVAALANEDRSVAVAAIKLVQAAALADRRRIPAALPGLNLLAQSLVPRVHAPARSALATLGQALPAETLTSLPASAMAIATTLRGLGLTDEDSLKVLAKPSSYRPLDPTGPYRLTAALVLKDEARARTAYEAMSEVFETDAEALQRGVDYLAWSIFLHGLDAFQHVDDKLALADFQRLENFQPHSKPNSFLSVTLKQARTLAATCAERLRSPLPTGPEPTELSARIAYWIARLPEINGEQNSQPGAPDIWMEDRRPPRILASVKLRDIGRAALPALVEKVNDDTPTRSIGYWRDFSPSRYWVTVGEAAQEIILAICEQTHLEPPFKLPFRDDPAVLRDQIRAWLKKLPPSAAP